MSQNKELGRKFDGDKPRWDLLPWAEVEEIVEILTFGAEKYSGKAIDYDASYMISSIKEELEKCQNVINVNRINLLSKKENNSVQLVTTEDRENAKKRSVTFAMQEEKFIQEIDVDVVTINGLNKTILTTKTTNEEIMRNGIKKILRKLKIIKREEKKTQNQEQETSILNKLEHFEKEGLQKKQVHYYWKNKRIDALYAEDLLMNAHDILITTIQQNSQEDIYVVGATTDLECLETLLKVLKKQYNIFATAQQINIQNNKIRIQNTGDNNWQHVFPRSRYIGAGFRHFIAWTKGEKIDPESGKSHLAHAICNLLFLMWADNNDKKSKEDAPTPPEGPKIRTINEDKK